MNELVNPPELGRPTGFSHAVVAGDTVYLAGQTAHGETLVEQFDTALGRFIAALRGAGGEPDDLVTVQVFTTDVSGYRSALRELGQVWHKHCGGRYPAMGLFGVSELFEPECMIEVMGVAVLQK